MATLVGPGLVVGYLTHSASAAGWEVYRAAAEARQILQASYSLGQEGRGTLNKLAELYQEAKQANWDGSDAEAVHLNTYLTARRFLNAVPFGHEVTVGTWPDGTLTIEWFESPNCTLLVSVDNESNLHYAARLPGGRKHFGVEPFVEEIPAKILELANEVVESQALATHFA